ncbi:hypothetical protein F2Q70_00037200 [Brassica cretica]|uniref:Uncharacterized protein n=1 Tax=Brassica cretica TaxID=69181 RepID=A0A8S9JQW6_BRACR|nr:hypothetical protein F2Q70_00037200 [Brassica cretica]
MIPQLLAKRTIRMGNRANPPDDPLGVHETTPPVEDEGADHSTNVDPPGPSVGDDDAAQELAKDAEE